MSSYRRPVVVTGPFRDADGSVIPYGHRWDSDGPPEDSYSVVTHPERFRPLHAVADALVADLAERFDVELSELPEDPATTGDAAELLPDTVLRTTSLRPRDPAAATLTVTWTALPGLGLAAGAWWRSSLPVCGCDACDDDVERLADELERTVGAITAGAFREWRVRRADRMWHGHALGPYAGGSSSGESWAATEDEEDLGPAGPNDRRWAPWPTRRDG
ncbi:hypothetical protein Ae406Ps2_0856c [Pseudonocardia sp. Ae406_Ps2]|uniref:DUF6226 family protein n=1 Tax=unclassified Pseudonocardia TaxID=2619320 RepID=UPI00094B4C6C|nr:MULTISPECIES: DUF6226 family protein [unclassified Pseudonocardia]OLM00856.1 hypothetical protein Ae406Ps2_0856c [Pseudonocardia sp. Ae406_Ps2]OLM07353.1 hypothetical protein Ae331Ps2_5063 [Pseudonocardia sp. Ae331_Ps2]OLM14541.1 hypothetical protein Ae505Ps2_4671 [Pseudonocardia sp. Ae505_Ps2]OLM22434.1 hypothetical protein Ae706Ps2_0866c [Pseudonocardia sp. Ae706_Ps2]OLM31699.1 hypothetical protein Ae717Ps2_2594 [Pseudonocardia sp. Ae717_Ps2]